MADQTTINRLIGEDNLKEAFELLLQHAKEQAPEQHETLTLLAARWEKMRRQEMENTEDPEALRREHSRIVKALIQLNNEVFGVPRFLGSRKSRLIAAASLVVLASAFIFWLFQPKEGVEGSVEVSCKRVSFTFRGGNGDVFDNERLRQLRVQNFSQTSIQAGKARLDLDADGAVYEKETAVPEGLINLLPIPDAGGPEFSAGPLRLSTLDYAPGARLSVGTSLDNPHELQLDILHSARSQAEFDFSDSLFFFANLMEVSGPDAQGLPDQIAGLVVPDAASKIFVEGDTSFISFYLEFADSLRFKIQQMRVGDLDFSLREGQERLSSILSGQIRLTDARGKPYKTISIEQNDELLLAGDLLLSGLSVRPEGISLQLTGKLKNIRSGSLPEPKLQNPLTGEWLWHNHTYTLLAGGFALLAALGIMWFGFPSAFRRMR